MEPTTSILLEPKAEVQLEEDFVHVDDHSHSILNVDKEEEAHSDSGSVITGVVSVVDASDDDGGDCCAVVETMKLELPEEYEKSVMVSSKLDVLPGPEFRVAHEEAHKYGGKVILGDRPVQVTLKRTWAKMPLWHKVKFIYGLVFQPVFLPSLEELKKTLKAMDDVDMLTLLIQEMSKEFPSLMDTLVHERDKYMSCMLSRVASEHSSVVAVVGRGHLQGIKKNWTQPIDVNEGSVGDTKE
ncbi:hypothetical protein HA466_0049910 [Hirschfeldia incana]|nr:hypothetical protein HA466_0049910 [Hirschfeldia incana]